jgi:hypothetical protein
MGETMNDVGFLWSDFLKNNNLEDQEGNEKLVLITGGGRSWEGQGGDGK